MLGLQRLLYGPLRPIEVEQLYEKAWFAITETCLAMTIFREDLGAWFYILFVSLLIGKVWGWIGEGRVEILDQQPPANPRIFHARLASSLVLSIIFDLYFLDYTVETVRVQVRPNMIVMFAFEFAVLSVNSVSTCIRYCISLREIAVSHKQVQMRIQERREQIARERRQREQGASDPTSPLDEEIDEEGIDVPGWEEKGRWIFYLDLATGKAHQPLFIWSLRLTRSDFIKLVLYLTFFCVLCVFYGMPIHIIRDVAITIRSFYKRIADFVKYRQATQDMHARYPDATAEELGAENVCIICREPMRVWRPEEAQAAATAGGSDERLRPKKLPCGHVLHFSCLRSWLERQQNCPTCRQPVLVSPPPRGGAQGNVGAQPGAGGNAAGGAPGGQQRPGQNRIRFFNFGPLRLGFGAGPDIHRLAQQMQNPPAPQDPQAVQQARTRLDGRSGPASSSILIRAQIESIERQLLQEVNSLQIQSQELATVRTLVSELARLRTLGHLNQGMAAQPGQTSTQTQNAPQGLPPLPRMAAAPIHIFGAQENPAPQQSFPEGLTIPPGWSLIPLQRINGGHPPGVAPHAAPGPSAQQHADNNSSGAGPTDQPTQVHQHHHSSADVNRDPASSRSGLSHGASRGSTDTMRPPAPSTNDGSEQAHDSRQSSNSGERSVVQTPAESSTESLPPNHDRAAPPSSSNPSHLSERPPAPPDRKVDSILGRGTQGESSSTARERDEQGASGIQLPNWRSHATTIEDEDSN